MTPKNLREAFEKETTLHYLNDDGEPEIDYVDWLESNLCPPKQEGVKTAEEIFKEEIFNRHDSIIDFDKGKWPQGYPYIFEAMKEYAAIIAEAVKQKCADEANVKEIGELNGDIYWIVDRDSILSVDVKQLIS